MNDFTKEELILIKAYMFGGSYSVSAVELDELEEKMQSIIENYCEHDLESACGCLGTVVCCKCNTYF